MKLERIFDKHEAIVVGNAEIVLMRISGGPHARHQGRL